MMVSWAGGVCKGVYPPGRGQPVTKLDQEKTAAVQAVVTRAFGVSRTTIYKALNTTETGQP